MTVDFTNLTIDQFMEQLSPTDFIQMAEGEKNRLLIAITAYQHQASYEAAKAKRLYYQSWAGKKGDERIQNLRSDMEYWMQVWRGLEQDMSGLQSALKTDRDMNFGGLEGVWRK